MTASPGSQRRSGKSEKALWREWDFWKSSLQLAKPLLQLPQSKCQ